MLTPSSVSVGIRAFCTTWPKHAQLAEALRAERRDEVGLEHLEHPDAQRADQERHDRERGREARQDEAVRCSQNPVPKPPTGNQPQLEREELDQDDSEPERGQRRARRPRGRG